MAAGHLSLFPHYITESHHWKIGIWLEAQGVTGYGGEPFVWGFQRIRKGEGRDREKNRRFPTLFETNAKTKLFEVP